MDGTTLGMWRLRLRTSARTLVVLAVLLGLAGGVALAAAAAARRTASAYPRFLEASEASDLTLDTPPVEGLDEAIAALPQITRVSHSEAVAAVPVGPGGGPDLAGIDQVLVSEDGRYYDVDRLVVTEGRMPDPTAADEIVVNPDLAEARDLHVGSRLPLYVTDTEGAQALIAGEAADLAEVPMRVVGIALLPSELVEDDVARSTRAVVSPAFPRAHPGGGLFGRYHFHLRNGDDDVPAVQAALRDAISRGRPTSETTEGAASFEITSRTQKEVQRGVRPQVAALAAFAVLAGLVAVLVVGQALSRHVESATSDFPTLRALGVARRQLVLLGALDGAAVAVAGALLAVGVAVVLSPIGPVGAVRRAEPHPGVAVDATALVIGAVALAVLVAVRSLFASRRAARPGARALGRSSRLADQVAGSGVSVAVGTGVRLAADPGWGRRAVPVRATVIGATAAIAAVLAAAGFGAGLSQLTGTPRLYGWDFDVLLTASGGYGRASDALEAVGDRLDGDRRVAAYATVAYDVVSVDGHQVGALGLDARKGTVVPPIVDGVAPGTGEVLLGTETLRDIDKHVGDVVTLRVGVRARQVIVSGRAVFPAIGRVDGLRPALGEGVALPSSELVTLSPQAFPNEVVVRYAPGVDPGPVTADLTRAYRGGTVAGLTREVVGAQRPAEIAASDGVGGTPALLAAVLGLVAVATLGHALLTSVHRRRTDLALLRTFGFSRGQLLTTVAVQAVVLTGTALLVALPVGVAAGRWSWTAFADGIGVVPRAATPPLLVLSVVVGSLLLSGLVALVPGRLAARTRPAGVLRSE